MVTLKDSRDRSHPRTMAVARRETVRTNADGTVSVDADEHVATLKAAGFKAADSDGDLTDLTIGELRDKAEDAGIADETDLRSKDSIVAALRDVGGD